MNLTKRIRSILACTLAVPIMVMGMGTQSLQSFANPAIDSPGDSEIDFMRIKNHQGPSGVALGGTGVGYYEISPDGKFTRNCINNIHKSFVDSPEGMFLATWQDGSAARLQRDDKTVYGMKGYTDSYYTGLFPRLELDLEGSKQAGVANASFKANSGVVAQNIKDSSLPVTWYEVELQNDSADAKEMSALFSWADLIGRGIRDTTSFDKTNFNIDGESRDWFYMTPPSTTAEDIEIGGWKGVRQSSGEKMIPHKMTFQNYNTDFVILAEDNADTTVTTLKSYALGNETALQDFVERGELSSETGTAVLSDGSGSPDKPTNASAVAVSTTVPAGSTKTVRFMVSWFMPEYTADDMAKIESKSPNGDYNKYYHNYFSNITELAEYAVTNGGRIYDGVMQWQQPILDSNMPAWLQFKQINSTYTLFSNGVLNKRANFSTLEGEMGGFGGTMDQKMSSHPMYEKLFPQLNLNENRQFANVTGADGEIQHFDVHYYVGMSDFDPANKFNPTPNGSMIDNSGAWMVQMLNHYRQTGDATYMKEYYPVMKKSMSFIQSKCPAGTNIPNYNTTYDDYSHPQILIFSGTVYLNMLDIAQEFASINNDPDAKSAYQAQYEKTYADVQKLYLEDSVASYYSFGSDKEYIASDKASGSVMDEIMFSGAMAGQFISRYSGTGDIIPFENYVSHMKKFILTSVQESNDYFAPKVYNWVTRQSLDGSGSRCWPFYLDSYGGMAAIQAGFVEDGLEILEHTQLVNFRQGYTWTQNLWNPGYSTYMTAPVVWFMGDVLAGSAIDVPNNTLTLGPTTIPGTDKLIVPLYYPKYWAELSYDESTGEASYTITKTFYGESETPIAFDTLRIAPTGTATDLLSEHAIDFTVQEGNTLDLSGFMDNLGANVARDKNLEPVKKYGSQSTIKIAEGTGLSTSYYNGTAADEEKLVATAVSPTVDFTWDNGEYPVEGLNEEAYTIKYEGSILPRYGQTYELRFLIKGSMELTFDGRKIDSSEIKHEITNGNIEVPEGCTLNVFTVDLESDQLYPIEVTYTNPNAAEGGMMQLLWWSTTQTPDVIIKQRLYPQQSAYTAISATEYSGKHGNIRQTGSNMEYVEKDNWLLYKGLDFGKGMTNGTVSLLAAAPTDDVSSGGTVEVRRDSSTGELLGTIQFKPTGSWGEFKSFETGLELKEPLVGKQNICLVFHPKSVFLFNLRSFTFANDAVPSIRPGFSTIRASSFNKSSGRVTPNDDGSNIEYIENNNWVSYNGMDFGNGIKKGQIVIEAAVLESENCSGGTVEVRKGSSTGELISTVEIKPTAGWHDYQGFSGAIDLAQPLAGVQDIYLVFKTNLEFIGNVRSFKISLGRSAYESIPATEYTNKGGRVLPSDDGTKMEYIENDNWLTYTGLDFGTMFQKGTVTIEAAVFESNNCTGGTVEVRKGTPSGELLGKVVITPTDGWHDYRPFTGELNLATPISGKETICLVFKTNITFLGNVRAFNFTPAVDPENPVIPPSEVDNVEGAKGTKVTLPVTLFSFPAGEYKVMSGVFTIPESLDIASVTPNSLGIPADHFDFNLDPVTRTLRFAYLNVGKDPIKIAESENKQMNLITIEAVLNRDLTAGETVKIGIESVGVVASDPEIGDIVIDTSDSDIVIKITEPRTASAVELYTGDGSDLIPANKKAVSVVFTELKDSADVKLGDVQFYYNPQRSAVNGQVVYVGLVDADTPFESLSEIKNYAISETGRQTLTFGSVGSDNVINAQDALEVVYAWLRKGDAPSDEKMLCMNVSADGAIDTTDAIQIVNYFVDGSPFTVVTK